MRWEGQEWGWGMGAYIIMKFEKGIGFRIRNKEKGTGSLFLIRIRNKEKGTNFTPINSLDFQFHTQSLKAYLELSS